MRGTWLECTAVESSVVPSSLASNDDMKYTSLLARDSVPYSLHTCIYQRVHVYISACASQVRCKRIGVSSNI